MLQQIGLDKLKQIELEILKDVASYCDRNNLKYYLAYGTMLGAVRHKGFIPWDDDIDIMMPRKDYIKFINGYNLNDGRYIVKSIENDLQYVYTMAKVFDTETRMIDDTLWESFSQGGAFIDIFPIDGLPDSKSEQEQLFKKQQRLNTLFHGSSMKYSFSHHYIDSKDGYAEIKALVRTILKFGAITLFHALSSKKLIKKINENAAERDFETAKFVSVLVDCAGGNKREVLPRKIFDKRKKYVFEDAEFWGVEDYHFYLEHLFNDYMEMPPEHRIHPHHNFRVYWKNSL